LSGFFLISAYDVILWFRLWYLWRWSDFLR